VGLGDQLETRLPPKVEMPFARFESAVATPPAQDYDRGTRNLCEDVRYAVVDCDFVDVGGIRARDGTRRLDPPPRSVAMVNVHNN
jgi:hypothetical protein